MAAPPINQLLNSSEEFKVSFIKKLVLINIILTLSSTQIVTFTKYPES